jgi:Beta-lactamase superfamily domain
MKSLRLTSLSSLFCFFFSTGCASSRQYPVSDHYNGSQFYNQDRSAYVDKGIWDGLKWYFQRQSKVWPADANNNTKPDLINSPADGSYGVTFINHATVLIQIPEANIITDPIFSDRASPLNWIGPKRVSPPGLGLNDLPHIDVVLISHNHYDHMDIPSLTDINNKFHPLYIVPLGNAEILNRAGITNVVELDWWEEKQIGTNSKVVLTPAQHLSQRGLWDRRKALWSGFLVRANTDFKIFFAGDTGYYSHFKEIKVVDFS